MGVALIGLLVLTVACGSAGGGDVAAACDAWMAVDQAFNIDEDPEAGVAALEDFAASAPAEVAADVEPFLTLITENPDAAFESEEMVTAGAAADGFAFDNCGDATFEVGAVNFAFDGIPTEIEAGRVIFDLANLSQTGEFHEAILLRKNDDVAVSAYDALASALDESISIETTLAALESFELVNVGFVEPGSEGDVFGADLRSGEYLVVCLLPVDSPNTIEPYFMGETVEGDRHFDQGMFATFVVP
jgi:hypothetical protein